MSAETATNGTSSDVPQSAAERLMQQHAAQDTEHQPSVEEVVDEDAPHPAPSAAPSLPISTAPSGSQTPAEAPVSAKAAGKQPARDGPPPSNKPALDTKSEELFPSLGASKAPAAAPSMWSRKPAAVGRAVNGVPNGNVQTNGQPPAASNASSRTSTPISNGILTPASTAASQRGPTMSLPGRNSEQIVLDPSMLKKRDQLKKPVSEILRDINKRSKAKVEMKNGPGGTLVFEGTGPTDAVRVALKEAASQICAGQKLDIPIPASIRGRVVGKQGATIQAISKRTGARINITRQEAAQILEDDDLDQTVDVTIEGDPFAVQMARQDIEKIVNEHSSTASTRLKHIAPEYYPFLSAPGNSRLADLQSSRGVQMQFPEYTTFNQQAPPQVPANRGPASFAPQAGYPIQLSGDRQAVAEARAELDRQVAELQRQLTMEQVDVERGRHQFVVGDLGTSLNDFLAETGCSVILPPDGHDSDELIVVGPPNRIGEAIDKIQDLASAMSSSTADILKPSTKISGGGDRHVRDFTRYVQQTQGLRSIEQEYGARITPHPSGQWQIYAKDPKNALKARTDVLNLLQGHPPARFSPLNVDPFYREHLRQEAARKVRDQYGVLVVVPDEEDDDAPILLVYEDSSAPADYELPRKQPSAQEAKSFERALQEAQQHILSLIGGQQEIVSRDVEAPIKFHDRARKHVDRHHQGLPQGHIPVQVGYGGPRSASGAQRRAPQPSLNVRGPQDNVDALVQSLLAFIEQEKQDEQERGFKLSFDFPQKFASHLIGRGGENINKLREEFDVDIQIQDGKCEIQGPEAKANAAKKHILDVGKKLEDEATHHLNIPAQYHRDLIGPQGAQVNRLQDRYNVRVNFPRNKGGDDNASEAGDAPSSRKQNQQPNEVIVKGPSRGADACRDELLSLLQYVKDNSFSATVSVAQNQLPSLIGTGGREMEALRLETGAQVDVPSAKEAASANGRAEIKIKGSKQAVEAAKKLIEERAKAFDNTVARNLEVDRKHHRNIIGAQGSNLTSLIEQAGGPTDSRSRARTVRFPKTEAEGNAIRIEGETAMVEKLCAAILAQVSEQESQTNDIAEVKPDKHRLLIGRGGETRRQLEQQFGVQINIPRQTETGPQRSQVKIAGQPENVEKAKAHILELTKEQEGETVQIPRKYHHVIADNGQFFRRLRNDHKVSVDHAGQRPPPRASVPTPSRNTTDGAAMPLITDDPSANSSTHSWELHDLHASSEEGDIPWVLAGPSPEAISAARAKLDKALEEAGRQDSVGFLILPDPRAYRHVVGPGGSEINRIRKKTGTKIQVPRDQSKGEAIEIAGPKAGVEEARDIILEIVANNA